MDYPLNKLAELIQNAYMEDKITQQEQADMLGIINHLSLEPLIKNGKTKNTTTE